MNTCFFCSHVLLRHIRGNETYWFCRNCWQEMPEITARKINLEPMMNARNFRVARKKQVQSVSLSTI